MKPFIYKELYKEIHARARRTPAEDRDVSIALAAKLFGLEDELYTNPQFKARCQARWERAYRFGHYFVDNKPVSREAYDLAYHNRTGKSYSWHAPEGRDSNGSAI